MRYHHGLGKALQQRNDLARVSKMTERHFTCDKRMPDDLRLAQQIRKARVPLSQVVHPDRRIDQDHCGGTRWRGLRRLTLRRSGSEPPRAANLRALSRAMRASRPACTTAVFSLRPES